ncbi:MAG: hypothetical protein ACRC3H_03770 [Lachnospiraceae bacterium]
MKRRIFIGILVTEALACIVLCFLKASFSGAFSTVLAFPFEQIGMGLRVLSLSGSMGNAVAIVIYIATSMLPAIILLVLRKKRKLQAEDGLLVVLSILLFAVMYLMINPGFISITSSNMDGAAFGKAILGSAVYSVLIGYLTLRILRLFFVGGMDKLIHYMAVMLGLLNVIFVYLIFGAGLNKLIQSIMTLCADNAGYEYLLGLSYVCLILQFIVGVLPVILNVLIVFTALRLLNELLKDRYSAETVAVAKRMSKQCVLVLVVTILSNIGLNLFQLLFTRSLMVHDSTVQIPIFSIIFVLAILLLTRLFAANKLLKDDNDMFI